MKPLSRRPTYSDPDTTALPWDQGSRSSSVSGHTNDRALIPSLDWSRVCHHLPDTRRVRIDINGCFAGSPLCVAEAVAEFAVGWSFVHGFFSAPSDLKNVTASAQRVSIMVEGGADLDRRRIEAIGWSDDVVRGPQGPRIGEFGSGRATKAAPFIDDLDVLAACERVYRRFDADGSRFGYVHAALSTAEDLVCIGRDLSTEGAGTKILGWALRHGGDLETSMLVVRGAVDASLVSAVARAGVAVVVTDAVPTRSAVRMAGATCTTILGLALSHRRALFADGGHICMVS